MTLGSHHTLLFPTEYEAAKAFFVGKPNGYLFNADSRLYPRARSGAILARRLGQRIIKLGALMMSRGTWMLERPAAGQNWLKLFTGI